MFDEFFEGLGGSVLVITPYLYSAFISVVNVRSDQESTLFTSAVRLLRWLSKVQSDLNLAARPAK